jgi:hypothetical protein
MVNLAALQEPSGLGPFLDALQRECGPYEVLAHWQQGEFHHDLVLGLKAATGLPGPCVVVATNCNGGVKEVLWFESPPARWALWKWRCPDNAFFEGELPPLAHSWKKEHWFNPCELLTADARSELRPECRRQAPGGGWEPLS